MKLFLTSAGIANKSICVLNDNSAIKIDNENMEIISEGEWFGLN